MTSSNVGIFVPQADTKSAASFFTISRAASSSIPVKGSRSWGFTGSCGSRWTWACMAFQSSRKDRSSRSFRSASSRAGSLAQAASRLRSSCSAWSFASRAWAT